MKSKPITCIITELKQKNKPLHCTSLKRLARTIFAVYFTRAETHFDPGHIMRHLFQKFMLFWLTLNKFEVWPRLTNEFVLRPVYQINDAKDETQTYSFVV